MRTIRGGMAFQALVVVFWFVLGAMAERVRAADVVSDNLASLVRITATDAAGRERSGFGFVVSDGCEIVALARLVRGADVLTAAALHGGDPRAARVVAVSSSKDDLAVIRVEADTSDPGWAKAEERSAVALKEVVGLGLSNLAKRVNSPIIERLCKAGEAPPEGEAMFLVGKLIEDRADSAGARRLRVEVTGATFIVVTDVRIVDAQVGETVFAGGTFVGREMSGLSKTGFLHRGFVVTNRH